MTPVSSLRIVSLLPSATELTAALGATEQLVGISHECDYPEGVQSLPQLTSSILAAGLSPAESLACATATAAELTGLAAGTLEAGRLADLCLLRCNPLDPARLRTLSEDDVVGVWVGGQKGV